MNSTFKKVLIISAALLIGVFAFLNANAQQSNKKPFKVIAFYTERNDAAHISFVHEANKWFPEMGKQYNFIYDSTNDWTKLNTKFLKQYKVVLFLDTRPDDSLQRLAFEKYMKHGGGWMGFHFAGFALTPSEFPQNWNWYHNEFIAAGQYKSNTWRPTSAVLRVEDPTHPSTKGLPQTFKSAPNEWYRWENDLTQNHDIKILLAIDSTSFPLGTGPKLNEIWHSGYYPVAWTNTKYKMVYVNMGHNDMDYEHGTNAQLSSEFSSEMQNRFIINSLLWVAGRNK
jgi:hypothetical protein